MSAGSQHAHAAPVAIPFEPAVPGPAHDEGEIKELVAAFEKYDFRGDETFRAGLPSVIKSVKGRGCNAADIDDVIARAQWFYFTRRQQSQVPFDTYLRHRTSETESVPMGSSVTSDKSNSGPPPPAFSSQDPNPDKVGLAAPSPAPPSFTSRPGTPPKAAPSAPAPARPSAIPQYVDTDGEGGITVTRACISGPSSRAASPPPRDSTPASSMSHTIPQPASQVGGHDLSTGASALTTPALTSSSEASSPDLSGAPSGTRIENRVAVAAEMAAPAPSDSQALPQSQTADAMDEDEGPGSSLSTTAVVGSSAPGPIETTAPGPDGPQLPFDEVVRLISTGRADEVPHHDVPEGLNQTPASVAQMSARPKPWERATATVEQ